MNRFPLADLEDVLADHDGVLSTSTALKFMTEDQLRWRVTSGRWQKPARGVVAAQSGPLTDRQLLRAALLRAGPQAALAGLTAARLDGLRGFDDNRPLAETTIHLLAPAGYKRRTPPPGLAVATHFARVLTNEDVHPLRQPRRTRIETLHRRKLIKQTIGDIAGGRQVLSELDFTQQVIKAFRLPEPTRQAARRDSQGRRRWTDVTWDDYKIAVEIDGAQHTADPWQRWDDMERDIDLGLDGYQTLRFPAWLVRTNPAHVARKILEALRRAGYQG
jgi:hypothetical protein